MTLGTPICEGLQAAFWLRIQSYLHPWWPTVVMGGARVSVVPIVPDLLWGHPIIVIIVVVTK